MNKERKAKLMVAGGVGLFGIAMWILLLFLLPATPKGSSSVQAQMPPPPMVAPPAVGRPPMAPGLPGGVAPPSGMGMLEGATPTPEAVVPELAKGPPLEERSRSNPFAPAGVLGAVRVQPLITAANTYGPPWSAIPITVRRGFTPLERPERTAPPPPPPPTAKKFLRVSSIMWREGVPTATYETGDGKSGNVQPGDWVEDWQIIEIGLDYVIAKNRDTGEIQRVFLKGK